MSSSKSLSVQYIQYTSSMQKIKMFRAQPQPYFFSNFGLLYAWTKSSRMKRAYYYPLKPETLLIISIILRLISSP